MGFEKGQEPVYLREGKNHDYRARRNARKRTFNGRGML